MNLSSKIYVAGHSGLMGSALVRQLRSAGFHNLVTRTHEELDLTEQQTVREFFAQEQPEYVFHAAAKVGGILANSIYPGDFIGQNLLIQTNMIHEAYCAGVERLLFLGSSCIYPRNAPQPLKEEYLLSGELEQTNRPYAVAKIAGIEMCWAYNRQYGTSFLAAMPTNLFGPGDSYDPENSHVVAALIRKMHEAKQSRAEEVVIWGTGMPRREFLCSDDAADACVFLMNLPEGRWKPLVTSGKRCPLVNIGSGCDLTIREFAELVAGVVGFEGRLTFDPGKPDGTPRKLLDTARITELGWKPKTPLREGLEKASRDFSNNCVRMTQASLAAIGKAR